MVNSIKSNDNFSFIDKSVVSGAIVVSGAHRFWDFVGFLTMPPPDPGKNRKSHTVKTQISHPLKTARTHLDHFLCRC